MREAYLGALVVLEVHDFLDGRVVTTYGYLTFAEENIFIINQAYYFEDAIRTSPHLLAYCFTPRIPADPFDFISTYSDNQPV